MKRLATAHNSGIRTHLSSCDDAPKKNPEEEAVVLEMNVVDNQKTGVQQDRGCDDERRWVVRLLRPSRPSKAGSEVSERVQVRGVC